MHEHQAWTPACTCMVALYHCMLVQDKKASKVVRSVSSIILIQVELQPRPMKTFIPSYNFSHHTHACRPCFSGLVVVLSEPPGFESRSGATGVQEFHVHVMWLGIQAHATYIDLVHHHHSISITERLEQRMGRLKAAQTSHYFICFLGASVAKRALKSCYYYHQ